MQREALHHRLELLNAKLGKAQFYIAPHLVVDFQNSLLNVRISSDGLVEPASVDRRIKSILLFIPFLGERAEWKDTVPLGLIQAAYFQRIGHAFDELYRMMLETGANPDEFAAWFAADPQRLDGAIPRVDTCVADMSEFWEYVPQGAWNDLSRALAPMTVLAVEALPDEPAKVIEPVGVDFDIAVLPDPFATLSPALRQMDDRRRCGEALRCALRVLCYRDIILSAGEKPPVAFLPADRFPDDRAWKGAGNGDERGRFTRP